ncbi:MAG TPA: DNA-formamidopyrimidine glycosylase family protein [Nocardioidaceae bacterium]|nr:DNA-formamidopyrimidine glycosylase family protein [Nocardioidaceae bacterium]
MPEGHTLHRIAAEIDAAFSRRRVAVSSPQGRFADSAALLDRATLRGAEAAGKHLLVEFSGRRLVHVHLGLIGSFVVSAGVATDPRGAVRLRLRTLSGTRPAYADLRGPAVCELVGPGERDALLAGLGPDPLRSDADPDQAWRRITRSQVSIAALLMRQEVLAGVGNVYRAELLFRHGIDPHTPGIRIDHELWSRMWDDLVRLMHEGVTTGRIDTVRREHTPEAMGRPARVDDHGGEVYVYRRAGMPCWVCGEKVHTELLAGRNLFWCPRCQRAP